MKKLLLDKTSTLLLAVILLSSLGLLLKIPFGEFIRNSTHSDRSLASTSPYVGLSGNIPREEYCDEADNIRGTICPCAPEDSGLASLCGMVTDANISEGVFDPQKKSDAIYANDLSVEGVTVNIYEYSERAPTGKYYGDYDNKIGDCWTSKEGLYHCFMRKVTPGLKATVVYSCGGQVKKVKVIPSYKDFTNLNARVDCSGDQEYAQTPVPLSWINRNMVLSCLTTSNRGGVPDSTAALSQTDPVRLGANLKEVGGETRFAFHEGVGLLGYNYGDHPGSYEEKDCLTYYKSTDDLENPLEKTFEFSPKPEYPSVAHKCNFDPEMTGEGLLEKEYEGDYMTAPFEYSIPIKDEETEKIRSVEGKSLRSREVTEYDAPAQVNQSLFSEAVHMVAMRTYEQESEKEATGVAPQPVDCEVIKRSCAGGSIDPFRNEHTTGSFGARLGLSIVWKALYDSAARERTDPVCTKDNTELIRVADIEPPYGEPSCAPGAPGCKYKLDSTYFCPQFFVAAGGLRKPTEFKVGNDRYESPPRRADWQLEFNESKSTHSEKSFSQRADTSPELTNSAQTAVCIANEGACDTLNGSLTDVFSLTVETVEDPFDTDIDIDSIIYDYGDSPAALCAVSNVVSALIDGEDTPEDETDDVYTPLAVLEGEELESLRAADIPVAEEPGLRINNKFKGMREDHEEYPAASTMTYVSDWAKKRDEYLSQSYVDGVGFVSLWLRDAFDSLQRLAAQSHNEGGKYSILEFLTAITRVADRTPSKVYKSYANRNDNWTDIGFPSVMNVEYCISELGEQNKFNETFPSISEGGYPGDAEGCYPWNDLASRFICAGNFHSFSGDYADVWPGRKENWPPVPQDQLQRIRNRAGVAGTYTTSVWPGEGDRIKDEIATLKVTACATLKSEMVCDEKDDHDGDGSETCRDTDNDGDIDYSFVHTVVVCGDNPIEDNPDIALECLRKQQDSWAIYDKYENGGTAGPKCVWDYIEEDIEPFKAGLLYPHEKTGGGGSNTVYSCDLEKAGPMALPADIEKDQMELMDTSNADYSSDGIEATANYVEAIWSLPQAENNIWGIKASEEDSNTTLDADAKKDETTDFGARTWLTTGKLTRNPVGVGNVKQLQDRVGVGVGWSSILEDGYPDIPGDAECKGSNYGFTSWCPTCDMEDPGWGDSDEDGVLFGQYDHGYLNWCAKVLEPEEEIIDIDSLETGGCKPNLDAAGCPFISERVYREALESGGYTREELLELGGKVIGDKALQIVGAAGNHAGGIPGSLLLAFAAGERWIESPTRMLWTDKFIEKYSAPWYGRIYTITESGLPIETCNDMNHTAEGPYGWITKWFDLVVDPSSSPGGYHPARMSPTPGYGPIVSKCNFLDASYAAAWSASKGGTDGGYCGGGLTRAKAQELLRGHQRGSSSASEEYLNSWQMQSWIDIAVNCQ